MATKYRIVKREWFDTDDKLHVRFEPQHRFLSIFSGAASRTMIAIHPGTVISGHSRMPRHYWPK